jgi:hypothetical protein
MQLTASKSNLLVEIQRQNISMSIYDDQISFKYAYTEHSSRHRRSTAEKYNNVGTVLNPMTKSLTEAKSIPLTHTINCGRVKLLCRNRVGC